MSVEFSIDIRRYNYKYSFSVEIVPICREDLVCLPTKACVDLCYFTVFNPNYAIGC